VPGQAAFAAQALTNGAGNVTLPTFQFTKTTADKMYLQFRAVGYVSGNVTVSVLWGCGATSGNVEWGAKLFAVTPSTDTGAVSAKTFGTQAVAGATTVAATAGRMYKTDVVITSLDSLAADDWVTVELQLTAGTTIAGGGPVDVYDILVTSP
jgi:hypothetical protein